MKLKDSAAKNLSIFFSQIEPYMIADSFSKAVFLRAKSYVPKVKVLSQTEQLWTFEVKGGEIYYVRLEMKLSEMTGTCTCAHYHSGERCKHLAAAMLWAKQNPLIKTISKKELVANIVREFETLLAKINSRWGNNTVAFNAAFGLHRSEIIDFIADGEEVAFAELWLTIVKKITQERIFKTLKTMGGYYGRPTWAEKVVFIQITKAILKAMPLKNRLDWLEQLLSAQKDEEIFANFLFEAVFSIEEMAAVKAYTIKNIKSAKNKLSPAFFDAHKDMFSVEEQLKILEKLVGRDEKYYKPIIALLAKKPDEQRKYMSAYYSKYVPVPTKLKLLPAYIKNLTKAGLTENIQPVLDAFFAKYVFERDEDYAYIEKHFPQYLRQFCDNSYAEMPYQFYRSLQTNGLHSEMRLYLKDIIEQNQLKNFSWILPDTAEGAWVRFYKKYSKYYHQEAFDFYREALAQIMPPKSPRQSQLFIDILDGLMDIEPVYTMALIDIIRESYPKNISFLTKLGDFVAEQAAKNKEK